MDTTQPSGLSVFHGLDLAVGLCLTFSLLEVAALVHFLLLNIANQYTQL